MEMFVKKTNILKIHLTGMASFKKMDYFVWSRCVSMFSLIGKTGSFLSAVKMQKYKSFPFAIILVVENMQTKITLFVSFF